MDKKIVMEYMDKNYSKGLEEAQEKMGLTYDSNTFFSKTVKKTVKYLTSSKEYNTNIEIRELKNNLNNNLDYNKYKILQIHHSHEATIFYIDMFYFELMYKGGIIVIELFNSNKIKISLYYREQFKIKSLDINNTFLYLENIGQFYKVGSNENNGNKETINNCTPDTENISSDTYKVIKESMYPLKESIYLDKTYIHPSIKEKLNIIKVLGEQEYENSKRTVLNNNYRLNKLNRYSPTIIASNKYQELSFPTVGEQPNLEEFTDEYVWYDERIYLHILANEYIPFGSPDTYTSTSTSFGNVSIGNVVFKKGKDNIGFDCMCSGDFYITERQIIIFEKGSFSLLGSLLDADNYKRGVISILFKDINVVEGDKETGFLKIYKKNNNVHAFGKSNIDRQKFMFSEDELRYMVNLIGSLIEKKC